MPMASRFATFSASGCAVSTFDAWMAAVNAALLRMCGMDSDMLPDYGYYDAWRARRSPEATAKAAIRYAREY